MVRLPSGVAVAGGGAAVWSAVAGGGTAIGGLLSLVVGLPSGVLSLVVGLPSGVLSLVVGLPSGSCCRRWWGFHWGVTVAGGGTAVWSSVAGGGLLCELKYNHK